MNVNIEKYYKQEIRKEAKILNVSAGKIANTIIKVEKVKFTKKNFKLKMICKKKKNLS